jgi:Domain of unknown function (DUF4189)
MRCIVRVLIGAVIAVAISIAGFGAARAAGAFALGACAAFGYSYDFTHMDKARKKALANCKGKKCRVVATMRKRCAALAVDPKHPCKAYGWAVSRGLGRTQNLALRQCYRHGGRTCVIRSWVCDAKG